MLTSILTSDLGLVRAQVRSARVMPSKLRYGVEPLTHGRFSFVRGRHEWRLTGAEALSREALTMPAVHRAVVGRVGKLLLRLMPGTEPLPTLYQVVTEGFLALQTAVAEDVQDIECVLVLRILSELGYIPDTSQAAPFIEEKGFNKELLALAHASRPTLIRSINDALQSTGL